MGKPVVGDVVVVPFPFSDLTDAKRRPALVVADLDGDDLIIRVAGRVEARLLQQVKAVLQSIFGGAFGP